jgi:hypothetical protein
MKLLEYVSEVLVLILSSVLHTHLIAALFVGRAVQTVAALVREKHICCS